MAAKEVGDTISTKVDEIMADGDVVLIVGPDKRRLLVHSLFLKTASKVFKTMFGPHFSEGQDISKEVPKEILMPEDDADAMKIICAVIHLRNNAASDKITPDEVLTVAVTADKYNCIDPLKNASGHWLKPVDSASLEDLNHLMAAAYLFDDAQAFDGITRAMILHHTDSYIALEHGPVESILSWRIFCLLEERRSRIRLKLQQLLVEGALDCRSDCACGWTSKYAFAYLVLLEEGNLLPERMLDQSISCVMQAAEQMSDPTPAQQNLPCKGYGLHREPDYRKQRGRDLENLRKEIALCIDCVRRGSVTATPDCRIPH